MAISIYQQMNPITLCNDINPLTIYSTYHADNNFIYLYYIIDSDGVLSSMKQAPSPNDTGMINPNLIVKNMITYNFNQSITGLTNSTDTVYQYKVSYGSISDSNVDTLTSTNVVTAINGVSRYSEYPVDISDYILDSTSSKFLSDYNGLEVDLMDDDYYVLSFLNGIWTNTSYNSSVKYIVIEFTDGTKYAFMNPDYQLAVSDTLFNVNQDRIVKNVGVGAKNLLTSSTILSYPSGSPTTFPSNTFLTKTEYKVYAVNGSGTRISEYVHFNINCKRSYNKYQIFYMNDFGQFDSVTFNNGNWTEFIMKTETYRQNIYNVVNNQYKYTNGNRGLTTLTKNVDKTLTVISSYSLYEDIVENMLLSTVHYLVDDSTIIPLLLDSDKLKQIDPMGSKLNSYQIVFNYANKINVNI